jgi:Flp pilus assembly protein TadG
MLPGDHPEGKGGRAVIGKDWIPQIRHGARGQALVETALVTVLLLLLLLGVADFGRSLQSYIVITNAAREGARYAANYPHYADGIISTVQSYASENGIALADGTNITIDPDPRSGGSAEPGSSITVFVEYPFDTIMGSMIGISTITLRTATEMRVFGLDVPPP